MKIIRNVVLIIVAVLIYSSVNSQEDVKREVKHNILPVAFYLPETGFALGGLGIVTYNPIAENTRPSQFIYSAAYTFKNQFLLFLPFEIYTPQNEYRFKGELGFYKYFYNYYGIGSKTISSVSETYDVTFPRLDLNITRRVSSIFYAGAGLQYDHFNITGIADDGILDSNRPAGYTGGTKANAYLVFFLDQRDNFISTREGYYIQLLLGRNLPSFLSDFSYQSLSLDARLFSKIKSKVVWANRILYTSSSSSTPFFALPDISSQNRMRGYNDRRYMDYSMLTLQSEVRLPIKGRVEAVAFVGSTFMGPEFDKLGGHDFLFNYGAGLRFILDKENRSAIRFDVATGGGDLNFYITTNEAF